MSRIIILGTGGTIAGEAQSAADGVRYTSASLGVQQLLERMAGLDTLPGRPALLAEQVLQTDSKDMDISQWQHLLLRCLHWLRQPDVQGIVITHGTDTAEETAYFLHACLRLAGQAGHISPQQAQRPIVLTCAMRPATARLSDGPQNLADACLLASQPQAHGVLLACAGAAHHAAGVCKIHPYRLDAFYSPGGACAHMEEAQVRWLRPCLPLGATDSTSPPATADTHQPPDMLVLPGSAIALPADQAQAHWQRITTTPASDWPWTDILTSCAATQPRTLSALAQAGVQGLVLAGTGNATLHYQLEQAAQQAIQQHSLTIWRSSRCQMGFPVAAGHSPLPLVADGTTPLNPAQTRIALLLHLLTATSPTAA